MTQRSSPRKVSNQADLYACAVRGLMRRAYSIHEMKIYLDRRAGDRDLIAPVVARLRELKYLDDARYALDYANQHAKLRRQGGFRIARELRARGVPDRYIDAALESVFAETDESTLVRTRLKRRLAHLRGPLDQRKIASLYRSLLSAGFSSEVIRTELRAVAQGDLPDLPDCSASEEGTLC